MNSLRTSASRTIALRIRGGRVYDPQNGIDGEIRDVWIDDGRIVAPPAEAEAVRVALAIDAAGRVVMPGGVDMHCHIAGPAVNRGRRLLARGPTASVDGRRPADHLTPRLPTVGERYALLGYTTAIEAAIAPSGARQCHAELADVPNLDRGLLLLLANHELLMQLLERGEREAAREVVAWLLRQNGAYGIKAVNPGGVSHWLSTAEGIREFSRPIPGRKVSPRQIVEFLAETADELHLPHALHLHCNQLGTPGNVAMTLETSRALAGRRHHLTHVQFHAYGPETADGMFTSAAAEICEHLAAYPEVTADVGQVMFGEALTLTADAETEYFLWRLTGRPYVNVEMDLETGCGVTPWEYRRDSRLHASQWIIGMELFLLSPDPWRLVLSTDHPNGGSFLAYPTLIAQLMDRSLRTAALERVDRRLAERSALRDLEREYTLSEVAQVTRSAPARILGLTNKGHLAPGADADLTVYTEQADKEAMFRRPWLVVAGGEVLVDEGELRGQRTGRTWVLAPPADSQAERIVRQWYDRFGSYDPRQMGLAGQTPEFVRHLPE